MTIVPPYFVALFDQAGSRISDWAPANPDGSVSLAPWTGAAQVVRIELADTENGPVRTFSGEFPIWSGCSVSIPSPEQGPGVA